METDTICTQEDSIYCKTHLNLNLKAGKCFNATEDFCKGNKDCAYGADDSFCDLKGKHTNYFPIFHQITNPLLSRVSTELLFARRM